MFNDRRISKPLREMTELELRNLKRYLQSEAERIAQQLVELNQAIETAKQHQRDPESNQGE
jgi:hypothetical protein